jgi:hypothetical protein
MFRFTIRDLLWLMVVVALVLTWSADRWRQRTVPAALSKHLRERLEAAKSEFVTRQGIIGRHDNLRELDCLRDWAQAAIESDLSPADKIKECELALAEAEQIHQSLLDKYQADVEPAMSVQRAHYTVSDIQVRLQLAKKEANWFRLP